MCRWKHEVMCISNERTLQKFIVIKWKNPTKKIALGTRHSASLNERTLQRNIYRQKEKWFSMSLTGSFQIINGDNCPKKKMVTAHWFITNNHVLVWFWFMLYKLFLWSTHVAQYWQRKSDPFRLATLNQKSLSGKGTLNSATFF